MPDWSYQPIFKPLLFQLPRRQARNLTLAVTGFVAKLPLGPRLLAFMGDMHPHRAHALQVFNLEFAGRVGLGAGLAFDRGTILAFSEFGLGHIEVGPITVSQVVAKEPIIRDDKNQTIVYERVPENPGAQTVLEEIERALRRLRNPDRDVRHNVRSEVRDGVRSEVRLAARIANLPGSDLCDSIRELDKLSKMFAPHADFITLDTRWWNDDWSHDDCVSIIDTIKTDLNKKPIVLSISPDCTDAKLEKVLNISVDDINGYLVSGEPTTEFHATRFDNGKQASKERASLERSSQEYEAELAPRKRSSIKRSSIELVHKIRSKHPDKPIIASGGIVEPADALDFFDAGATLIQLHSGFIFSGPGLAKRINECIALRRPNLLNWSPSAVQPLKTFHDYLTQGWIGFALVAIGLIISSTAVIVVGLTTVLLPYDEAFLGVGMRELPNINANLLKFMAHDRVTLGGTSLSGAVLFLGLALYGVRLRQKWAYATEVAGLTAGFLAFFLYLGFKYFDPLHALVCILVFPFFIWGVVQRAIPVPEQNSNLRNDPIWRRSQVGQLMFVLIGFGLLLAGVTIAGVGCSEIFVKEDLLFMETTRSVLACHDHLLPLIAHDRASFGGSLWAVGTVELLTSLYGFRQGNRWVWWTLFLGGLPGFLAVLGIHFAIGYTHFIHLLPAYIAVAMYLVGLVCTYDYLCKKQQ